MAPILLSDELLQLAEKLAKDEGRSVESILEDALREKLAQRPHGPQRPSVQLPVFHGTGVRPGVDLNSNAALLDLMETSDGLSNRIVSGSA